MPIQLLAGIFLPNVTQQLAAYIKMIRKNIEILNKKLNVLSIMYNLKRGSNVRPWLSVFLWCRRNRNIICTSIKYENERPVNEIRYDHLNYKNPYKNMLFTNYKNIPYSKIELLNFVDECTGFETNPIETNIF